MLWALGGRFRAFRREDRDGFIREVDGPRVPAGLACEQEQGLDGTSPLVVLVVDDDEAQQYLLARTLELAGFIPRLASTGLQALELAREKPDIILLDVKLPDLLGFEVSRRLKADPATASIPIVQMSASFTTSGHRVEGLKGGADGYLIAPVEPSELVATLNTVLRMHAIAQERARLLEVELVARAALEEANARLRLQVEILDNVQDSIIVTDLSGRVTYWNEGATRVFGYGAAEMMGHPVSRLYPAQDPARLAQDLLGVEADGGWRVEWEGRRKDGSVVWADVRTVPMLSAEGTPAGFIGVCRDITELRRLREEALRRAEAAQRLMGVVSHDLRNPLNAILLTVELAQRRGPLDTSLQRTLTRVRTSAERMTRLVMDLLDFTQASLGGGIRVQPRAMDLHELTRQVVDEVRQAHPGRTLHWEPQGEAEGEVDGDRMAQVLTNLLANAVQYSPPDTPITVSSRGEDDALRLEVHNLGAPIPPEDQGRLFQPLQRGAGLAAGPHRSIGLGLFIVEHLVRAHGGSIQVRSSPTEGTTFSVLLPRRAPS